MRRTVKKPAVFDEADFHIVKNNGELDSDASLVFTFSNFKMYPIKIEGIFNNFFSDQEEYIRKITVFIEKALPLLSNETYRLFNDGSKCKTLHLHQLHDKEDILEQILKEYKYSESAIKSIMQGAELYQIEVPYENGATRVVFERIDNLISFLFLDPNHHIYLDKKFVDRDNSLCYEYCPIYKDDRCNSFSFLQTCLAFEYLDVQSYNASYGKDYDPNGVL